MCWLRSSPMIELCIPLARCVFADKHFVLFSLLFEGSKERNNVRRLSSSSTIVPDACTNTHEKQIKKNIQFGCVKIELRCQKILLNVLFHFVFFSHLLKIDSHTFIHTSNGEWARVACTPIQWILWTGLKHTNTKSLTDNSLHCNRDYLANIYRNKNNPQVQPSVERNWKRRRARQRELKDER